MTDILTETPEEKAALTALQTETPIELVPSEEVKETPKEEVKETPKVEAEPKKTVRLVPHEALHEERTKRKDLERRLQELESKVAPAKQTAAEPDETVDPIGTIGVLKAQLKELTESRQQETAVAQRNNEIVQRMAPRVAAAREANPAFDEMFQHVRQSRIAEYKALKVYPDQQIAEQVMREELSLAEHTLRNDLDPGEVIEALARTRGYQPKATQAKDEAKEEPKVDPKEVKALEDKIARIEKGQKAAKSPSGAGGSGPAVEMTLEQLASLEGAAFDAAFAKHGRRLMGG